jgi:hypothetical protein
LQLEAPPAERLAGLSSRDFTMKKRISKRIARWVDPALHDLLNECVCSADWIGALSLTSSENRISLCLDLIASQDIPMDVRAPMLADAISGGDNPLREREALQSALRGQRRAGYRVFDGDAARAAFSDLPGTVTIYRGTTQAEGRDYGVCWTLDREKALWFATEHGRFRNCTSSPVILSALINRDSICGLLFERQEREVLVCGDELKEVCSVDG